MKSARIVVCFCLYCLLPGTLFSQSDNLALQSRHAAQLMTAGEYEEAGRIYQKLVKALPNNPGLTFDLGLALHMSRHEREAIRQFNKTLRLDPHNIPACLYLAYAYLSLGEPARALNPLERVTRADAGNLDASESLAETLLALGRFNEAAEHFRAIMKARPESAAAWYGLGRSYQSLSQNFYQLLQKPADGSAYWLALVADANAKAGKYSSAFYLYHQALEKMPDLPGIHAGLAAIYSHTGHPEWAKTEQARAVSPPDCTQKPTACAFLAGHYDQVLADPGNTPAVLYWKCKAYDQLALQALLHLASFPSSPQLHELLAETHEKAHDYPAALQEWRKAYQLSGQDPRVGKHLAIALLQTDDNQDAEKLLGTILRRQPASAQANYLMGYALLNLQRSSDAIPYLTESLRLDPAMLSAHGALGRAYLQTGQSAKAVAQLKAALPLDQDGSLHYQLARAYQADGRRDLAQRTLQQYRQMHETTERESEELKKEVRITAPEGSGGR